MSDSGGNNICSKWIGNGTYTTVVLVFFKYVYFPSQKNHTDKVRIPAFIVVVATFVTMVQFMLEAYLPALMIRWEYLYH